jgi:lysylphosphatidylglycerol synthetase-like protein (DUF2156 family)
MNEKQKVNIAKTKLPIKTKIAVWWLILLGVAVIIGAILFLPLTTDFEHIPASDYLISIAIGLLCIVPGIILNAKTRAAWISAIVLFMSFIGLSISFIWYVDSSSFINIFLTCMITIIPLILLILDRNNYLKMVHQRELAKKDREKA